MEKEPRKISEIYLDFLEKLAQKGFDLDKWEESLSHREMALWKGFVSLENEGIKESIRGETIKMMDPELKKRYLKVAKIYGGS